jgi:uncharacterized protein (TIGR03067 family)
VAAVVFFVVGFGSAVAVKSPAAAPPASIVVVPLAPPVPAPQQAPPGFAGSPSARLPVEPASKGPPVVYLPPAACPPTAETYQAAAQRALKSLDGRWRVVRITTRKDRLEQSGIGHFNPELTIDNGAFHWTGQVVLALVDGQVQQRIAAMDPDTDLASIDRTITDWVQCQQQEQARIDPRTIDRQYVERQLRDAQERSQRGEWAFGTVYPTAGPNAIDFRIQGGPLNGRVQQGIYQVRGDTLDICVNGPATARRPTGFGPLDASDGSVQFTYQRVTPGTQVQLANCTIEPSADGCQSTAYFYYTQ